MRIYAPKFYNNDATPKEKIKAIRNNLGKWVIKGTHLVIDEKDKTVIGREECGKILPLTQDDVNFCEKHGLVVVIRKQDEKNVIDDQN